MPLSIKSWGVLNDPPETMTSRRTKYCAVCVLDASPFRLLALYRYFPCATSTPIARGVGSFLSLSKMMRVGAAAPAFELENKRVQGCIGTLIASVLPALERLKYSEFMQARETVTLKELRDAASTATTNPDGFLDKMVQDFSQILYDWSR